MYLIDNAVYDRYSGMCKVRLCLLLLKIKASFVCEDTRSYKIHLSGYLKIVV